MRELIISKNEAGQRFDKYLLKYLNKAGTGFIYKMLRKKNIVLNDKKAKGNELLSLGDSVKLYMADDTISSFMDNTSCVSLKNHDKLLMFEKTIDILYEDDNILLINKPCGVLSQKSHKDDISVNDIALSYLLNKGTYTKDTLRAFTPSVCNRLDRNTTGIIVVGKSLIGLQTMSRLFKERTIHKYYLALVSGNVKEKSLISGYIKKNEKTNRVSVLDVKSEGADYIETYYEPVKCYDDMTLLKVCLITGKTHQIRAHLSSINHPIIGDFKYGNSVLNKKYNIKSQLLHSYMLEFPVLDGEFSNLSEKVFKAPLPEYWPVLLEE